MPAFLPAARSPRNRGSMLKKPVLYAIGFALLLNLLGGLSAGISGPMAAGQWYQDLQLPRLQPPGPVFGIAWTLLYGLLGVAFSRLWLAPAGKARTLAIRLFLLQFVLNLAWSPVFFGAKAILSGLILIGGIFGVATIAAVAAGRVEKRAAWLMLPYLVWLGFAFMLNWRILTLNPGA